MPTPSSLSAALTEGQRSALARLTRAIVRRGGNITHGAADLGLSYQALRKKAKRWPHVQSAIDDALAQVRETTG